MGSNRQDCPQLPPPTRDYQANTPLRVKVETLPELAKRTKDQALRIDKAVAWIDGTIDIAVDSRVADVLAGFTVDQIHELVVRTNQREGR